MTVPRTVEQLRRAARETEQALDALDPAEVSAPGSDASDLRRLGRAVVASAEAEAEVAEAVAAARANGRSWGQIATMLGVTRQSARERFATVEQGGLSPLPPVRRPADDEIPSRDRSST
ncbi:sigma-70 family RNA polymerase sigma factor [Pseudonocardia sp. C8]|uniref:sigma-70 family RNA polymerase sigma factor n=1 Tax=Pseudonocardia sp. C8 TaxID=2762759 RepID=UPI00164343D0|nr:sigma-70 family RNA polymerase sigma factor [Pseudonocardia sp. C8]MBC3191659.1 sigma-70 family RNA polymerase sigma factor [Pseudonocardia sp. C8]